MSSLFDVVQKTGDKYENQIRRGHSGNMSSWIPAAKFLAPTEVASLFEQHKAELLSILEGEDLSEYFNLPEDQALNKLAQVESWDLVSLGAMGDIKYALWSARDGQANLNYLVGTRGNQIEGCWVRIKETLI